MFVYVFSGALRMWSIWSVWTPSLYCSQYRYFKWIHQDNQISTNLSCRENGTTAIAFFHISITYQQLFGDQAIHIICIIAALIYTRYTKILYKQYLYIFSSLHSSEMLRTLLQRYIDQDKCPAEVLNNHDSSKGFYGLTVAVACKYKYCSLVFIRPFCRLYIT
jgi:hypothetical protein